MKIDAKALKKQNTELKVEVAKVLQEINLQRRDQEKQTQAIVSASNGTTKVVEYKDKKVTIR